MNRLANEAAQATSRVGSLANTKSMLTLFGIVLMSTVCIFPLLIMGVVPWWTLLGLAGAFTLANAVARLAVRRSSRVARTWIADRGYPVSGWSRTIESGLRDRPTIDVTFAGRRPEPELVADLVLAAAHSSSKAVRGVLLASSTATTSTGNSMVSIPLVEWSNSLASKQRDFYLWSRAVLGAVVAELDAAFPIQSVNVRTYK